VPSEAQICNDEESHSVESVELDVQVDAQVSKTSSAVDRVLACCAPGFASCQAALSLMREDLNSFFRKSLNAKSLPRRKKNHPHVWDVGLCCGLHCTIFLVIVFLLSSFAYTFAHIVPTYWWMERHLDGLWGYALEDGHPYTAPVWMGEFGTQARGQYWLNFVRYLSIRDVDFAYWAINGLKWTEGQIDGTSGEYTMFDEPRWTNESFGILSHDYKTVRHPWKVMDLQALMESPARWVPDAIPCNPDHLGQDCGAR